MKGSLGVFAKMVGSGPVTTQEPLGDQSQFQPKAEHQENELFTSLAFILLLA
jgi:hypothetical protein